MKLFREMIMKDFGWKILSVAIAVIMWFMVININQPVDIRTYTKYITINNADVLADRGLTIKNVEELAGQKVSIKIKAQRTALDRLNQSNEWLQVSIDLSSHANAVDGDVFSVPVEVEMVDTVGTGYTIVSKIPGSVEVQIEKISTKALPVEIVVDGTLPQDAIYNNPILSATTVDVTGPASAVEKVSAVRGVVYADDVTGNLQISSKLSAYDEDGLVVTGVSLSTTEVTVTYNVLNTKSIPIRVNIIGTPARGYTMGEITSTPQTIEVVGEAEALDRFSYIQLPDIDVSGSDVDVKKSFLLANYLPEGVIAKDASVSNIQVNVEIASSNNRTVTIGSNQLTINGKEDGQTYQLEQSVTATLVGDEAQIQAIDETTLHGVVNVGGLENGTHNVPIQLELPDGVTCGTVYIDVVVAEAKSTTDTEG